MTHTRQAAGEPGPAQATAATGYWPAVGDAVHIRSGTRRGLLGVVVAVEQYQRDWCRVRAEGRRGSHVYHRWELRRVVTEGER